MNNLPLLTVSPAKTLHESRLVYLQPFKEVTRLIVSVILSRDEGMKKARLTLHSIHITDEANWKQS
jgi:hypothetical protein